MHKDVLKSCYTSTTGIASYSPTNTDPSHKPLAIKHPEKVEPISHSFCEGPGAGGIAASRL